MGLPKWLSGEESDCQHRDAGEIGWIPGSGKSPGVGNGNQFQYILAWKFYGQRSLVGYRGVAQSQTERNDCAQHTRSCWLLVSLGGGGRMEEMITRAGEQGLTKEEDGILILGLH